MNFDYHLLLLNTSAATSFFCQRISAVNIKTIPPDIPLRDFPWHSFKDFTLDVPPSLRDISPSKESPPENPTQRSPLRFPLKSNTFPQDLSNTFPQFGFFLGVPLRFPLRNLSLYFPQRYGSTLEILAIVFKSFVTFRMSFHIKQDRKLSDYALV